MTRDEVFQGKYLKAVDLKGKACVVRIESAPYETLKSLDGKETQKIVLHFQNAEKTLPLNATNFDGVCDATGCPDTDDWPGCRIELYPTKTHMGGQLVDCIRIRQPSAKPQGRYDTLKDKGRYDTLAKADPVEDGNAEEIPF
jgi:hypothetical protein